MTVVLVGRLTPTDANPGETTAPWEAFQFESREAAEKWDKKPWYPDAMILDLIPSQGYTAEEFVTLFFSHKYDHLTYGEFRERFPLKPGELERIMGR
jgi:hypothetical protein